MGLRVDYGWSVKMQGCSPQNGETHGKSMNGSMETGGHPGLECLTLGMNKMEKKLGNTKVLEIVYGLVQCCNPFLPSLLINGKSRPQP